MPFELAMQRELAYRKKVDMLLLQLHGGVSRGILVRTHSINIYIYIFFFLFIIMCPC